MKRTDREKEGIMGKIYRMLCGLFVVTLIGAACATAPQTMAPASTAKQMVVITIDPETGSVVSVQDNRGNTLKPPVQGQPQVGTLATSREPITINVELRPATGQSSQAISASGGTTSVAAAGATAGASCRIIIVNGTPYCR